MILTTEIGMILAVIFVLMLVKGSYAVIRFFLKLLKYGIIIYLLIFFKNLYSETGVRNNIITVRTPDIIDISDLDNTFSDYPSFNDQMDFYNPENQQRLKDKIEQIKQAQQNVASIGTYKDSIEQGLNRDVYSHLEDSTPMSGSNHNNLARPLRGIGPESEAYNNLLSSENDITPVPPAIIPVE